MLTMYYILPQLKGEKEVKKNDNKLDYVLPYDVKRPTSITIPQTRGVGELVGVTNQHYLLGRT